MKQQIRLSDHFTYKRLLRFTLSPILMMIFTSVYSVVDGVFVSVVAGDIPFKAVNLIYPFIMMLGAFGFMMGAGGTAVVSKTLGEGDKPAAQRYFTFIVIFTAAMGVVLAALGLVFVEPITALLGGEGEIYNQAVLYARILLTSLPLFMLQNLFQSFFIAAEKPKLGFAFTVASGVANMVLDALFVAVFKWGIVGAAVATAVSQLIGGIAPVVYFVRKNGSLLRFVKTGWHGKVLFDSCTNGSSELLSNIAMSLVSMVYNKQLLAIVGDDGVGAYGVIMYVSFIFVAIFLGYSVGTAPIVGYNYGAQNKKELQNIFNKSMKLVGMAGIAMFGLSFALSTPLGTLFFAQNNALADMTAHAMRLYSFCFLFCGYNIFGSAFFTALGNGPVSALLSFARTLVFQLICVFVMPLILGLDGVWLSCVVGDVMCCLLTILMLFVMNKRYGYIATRGRQNTVAQTTETEYNSGNEGNVTAKGDTNNVNCER